MTKSSTDLLLVIEAEIATTQLVEQILRACASRGVRTTKRLLSELTIGDFGPSTVPLFVRCGDPRARAWADALSAANHAYAYYIDDNFWRIVGKTMLSAYYGHPAIRRSLEAILSQARLVITGSSELAEFVSQYNSNVAVLPTFFDFSLIESSYAKASPRTEVRIGFAGSSSRLDDLVMIAPVIPRILKRFPQAVFEFAGAFPQGVTEGDRVRRFGYQEEYSAYIRWQATRDWAVGLAPLIDHEANRSKTDNKYREYGAFGYAGIYSAIPPYTHVVKQHETGLLVENTPEAWEDAISTLLAQPGKRETIARQAFDDVRARYDLTQVSERWSDLLQAVFAERPSGIKPIDEISLRRALNYALIERWQVHLALLYQEGRVSLVATRGIRMIARRLKRMVSRA